MSTPQFGAGPALAAQCPYTPPPEGWVPWTDADGPVPDSLAARTAAIESDLNLPLGVTESYPLPGVTVLIRVEPNAWRRDGTGALVSGCFRSAMIYLPDQNPRSPSSEGPSKIEKTVGVLTAVSLAVGTAVTIAKWKKK